MRVDAVAVHEPQRRSRVIAMPRQHAITTATALSILKDEARRRATDVVASHAGRRARQVIWQQTRAQAESDAL